MRSAVTRCRGGGPGQSHLADDGLGEVVGPSCGFSVSGDGEFWSCLVLSLHGDDRIAMQTPTSWFSACLATKVVTGFPRQSRDHQKSMARCSFHQTSSCCQKFSQEKSPILGKLSEIHANSAPQTEAASAIPRMSRNPCRCAFPVRGSGTSAKICKTEAIPTSTT